MRKLLLFYFCFLLSTPAISQVGELNFFEIKSCIPDKFKDSLLRIEKTYDNCVATYNESFGVYLKEGERLNKLKSVFIAQIKIDSSIRNIWTQTDSVSQNKSQKYFDEANNAYSHLTDSINVSNPNFTSSNDALFFVEKMHQIILLEKFGMQVGFGCIKENSDTLVQPTNFGAEIVINLDMIERFRKIWNETSYPLTYNLWTYSPAERKTFSNSYYATKFKDYRYEESKINRDLYSLKDKAIASVEHTQNNDTLGNQKNIENVSSEQVKKEKRKSDRNSKKYKDSEGKGAADYSRNKKYPVKNEDRNVALDLSNQFIIKDLVKKDRIASLGVDYFTIQVAASRSKLDIGKIKKDIYTGEYAVNENNEDGWYRYTVGKFSSIDSANRYLTEPNITQGFVSGYSNSKGRVAILSVKQSITAQSTSAYSVVYRVQIAASRERLSNNLIEKIYQGKNPINISFEDGWFRYSIGDYIYIEEARITKDSCGIKEAFIMPYQNGNRIQWPSKVALNQLRTSQYQSAIYVVQVAASKSPLPSEVLLNLIKVDYPLTMKFEDGWYKYYISAFTDFNKAKEVAAKIGIKGAFIATYKNGIRVNP